MCTGPVAAYLAEVRNRIALVNLPAVEPVPVPGDDAGNARLRLWLEDAPRLLTAVEAVLALTRDTDGNDLPGESEIPVGEFQAVLTLLTSRPRDRVTKEDK